MLLDAGGTIDDVAAELTRRWGFRPRAAYRHAHGWSQVEAAVRFREVARRLADTAPVPGAAGTRIGEYERWPHGGRRPSPYVLAVLSEVYGTTVGHLLDMADFRRMPARDQAVVAALVDREEGARPAAPPPGPPASREPGQPPCRAGRGSGGPW